MEGKQSKIDLKPSLKNIDIAGGKVYRNPFLNFLRDFRKSHKHKLDVMEITKRAAQLWRIMNERERSPYINMSRQAPKRRRRKRRISTQKAKSEPIVPKKLSKNDAEDFCKCASKKCLKHPAAIKKRIRSKKVVAKAKRAKKTKNLLGKLPRRKKCVCGRFVKFL